jgi:5,10-methylenetetrahydrofolate reductase
VSVELTAPAGTDLTKTKQQVASCSPPASTSSTSPTARARRRAWRNLAVCARLAAETAVEPILHVCARDKQLPRPGRAPARRARAGLNNLVIITGDPPKMGDYPFSTPVYDVDSIGLLRIAAGLNAGVDPAGKPTAPTSVRARHRRRARRRTTTIASCAGSRRRRPPAPSW